MRRRFAERACIGDVRQGEGTAFVGKAGVVRRRARGVVEMTLVHGSRISAGGMSLATTDPELGIAAVLDASSEVSGVYHAPAASSVRIEPVRGEFYIDGERQVSARSGDAAVVPLPPGTHRWQMTVGEPVPNAPRIARTETIAGGGSRIIVLPVAGATRYRYELSRDGGKDWTASAATLQGLTSGTKVHVRAVAVNGARESAPGPEYPVYITNKPPLPPDGLSVFSRDGAALCTWGEVLGVTEYRLYADGGIVYHGLKRQHADPHAAAEYSVSAVDGNGEGPHSIGVRTGPGSWLTFDPKPGERFRRGPVAPIYYPE